MYNHKKEALEQLQKVQSHGIKVADSGPIEMSERWATAIFNLPATLLPLFSGLLCSPVIFIIRLPNTASNKGGIPQVSQAKNYTTFNRTSPSRTVPYRTFQQSIRFGSYIIRTVHCRARALGP
jgi:hypothetical protein